MQDLKGKPVENLIWKSPEDIPVKPIYTNEDIAVRSKFYWVDLEGGLLVEDGGYIYIFFYSPPPLPPSPPTSSFPFCRTKISLSSLVFSLTLVVFVQACTLFAHGLSVR